MKKFITCLLCLGLLAGCGGNANDLSNDNSTSSESNQIKDANDGISIDEQVIFDQDGIVVTVKGLEFNNDPELLYSIENNSNQDIIFKTENVVVNGFTDIVDSSRNVSMNKKINGELKFISYTLNRADIKVIKEISFDLKILDSDSEELYETQTITLTTNGSESYIQEVNDSGNVVVDANGIKIIEQGLNEKGNAIMLYIENQSGKNIMVESRDDKANGSDCSGILIVPVVNGTKAVSEMTCFSSEYLDGIEKIDTYEHRFHIYNIEEISETILDSEIITYNFE